MFLTPSIEHEVIAFDPAAKETAKLSSFEGLHLMDYEIAPPYIDDDKYMLEAYRKTRSYDVQLLTNNDFLLIEK